MLPRRRPSSLLGCVVTSRRTQLRVQMLCPPPRGALGQNPAGTLSSSMPRWGPLGTARPNAGYRGYRGYMGSTSAETSADRRQRYHCRAWGLGTRRSGRGRVLNSGIRLPAQCIARVAARPGPYTTGGAPRSSRGSAGRRYSKEELCRSDVARSLPGRGRAVAWMCV